MKHVFIILASAALVAVIVGVYFLWFNPSEVSPRTRALLAWLRNPAAHADWRIVAGQRCADAPFSMPTSGYIGFLWDDSFRPGHRHQGIDIFGGSEAGSVPVYIAYDGYLTRLPDWKSTVIVRIPSDPFNPGTQIWTYYTHMAYQSGESLISKDFPPGASEVFVKASTLLGYQGNYSGTPGNPTGVHLHFSVLMDNGSGGFLNELEIDNTLDPSPYLGMLLNSKAGGVTPVVCAP